MGTTGSPENSDVQNLFKNLSQPGSNNLGPLSYGNSSHPFHNFPASSFSQTESYDQSTSSLPGSYSLIAHGSTLQQHPSFSNDQVLAASHQIHTLSQPFAAPISTSFHTKSSSRPSSPSVDSECLKVLLSYQSTGGLDMPVSLEPPSSSAQMPNVEVSLSSAAFAPALPSAPPVSLAPASSYGRLVNNKLARGRHLKGEHVVYDVDMRLPGDVPPQLEVTPITMYMSQSVLLNGRQIAVNRNYICYGLRPNRHIRILNINTALRSLLRGHSERVTDMAFFAEDVHLLASASSDGRVFVRKIVEGPDEDNKLQITDQILLAIHFVGDWDSVHPHICWLFHTQDVLVVGMNKYVFIVDIPTVRQFAAPNGFDVEEPVHCPVHNLIEGVCCINEHDGDITDIATSQWGLSTSASNDGMIRLWKDRNVSSLTPHQGQQVGAVALLSAPLCPDHIVLLSAGPLCRELKLWVPATRDGWFPQSGQFKWKCIQTLELTSSAEEKPEDSFFNQVLVVPRANVVLLANAKKSALYVVHVNFGTSPAATHLDYLTEFSVMWPILSFTATSENVLDGNGFVQVYCVQTQAIQQYSLDLMQCLPPAGQHATENNLVYSSDVSSGLNTERLVSYEISSDRPDANSNMNIKSPQPTSGTSSSIESIAVDRTDTMGISDNVPFPASQSVSFSIDMASVGDSRLIGISATDAKEVSTRDVPVHVSKISAPTSQVEGPVRSPRSSPLAKGRARSPTDDRSIFHAASTRENVDYFASYEQPEHFAERMIAPSSPKHAMWDPLTSSPRRHFNDSGKMNEDKEWQSSVNVPILPDSQSNTGSTMHLITPSELMSMVARSKIEVEGGPTGSPSQGSGILKELIKPMPSSEQYMGKGDLEALMIETKEMNETPHFLHDDMGSKKVVLLRRGVPGSDPRIDRTSNALLPDSVKEPGLAESAHFTQDFDSVTIEEAQREDDHDASEEREPLQLVQGDENSEQLQEVSAKVDSASAFSVVSQTRRKKNKNKTTDTNVLMNLMPTLSTPVSSVASTSEQDSGKGNSSVSPLKFVGQITAMQESVNQLLAMQKDFQKQIQVILTVPVAKEVKRVEAVLGQRIEKVLKAHMDAMWARLQEDFAKREKADREQMQQLSSYLSNYLNKDLPVALERALKKEFSTLGPSVARLVTPNVEKSITASVNEAFQKGISEKGISQLEKSVGAKIEASLSRQLQSQFQTTGKSALQEALRSSLEGSVIPAFERSCQTMFAQVDAAFQKGFADDQTQAQQQFATSAIASSLQEAVNSATSLAASLADGQRRLSTLIESAGVSRAPYAVNGGLPDKVMTVQHVEESLDPTKELARLLSEREIEKAFNKALSLTDVGIVSWLCNQVNLETLLTTTPIPLSQGVLLALVQQLGCDLGNDTGKKLTWIKDAALALNPHEPGLPPHVMRHFLEKLYNNLHALLNHSLSADLILSTRLVIHVVNSLLTACN